MRGCTAVGYLVLLAVAGLVAGACVPTEAEVAEPVPTLFDEPIPDEEADTTSTQPTTTLPVADRLPPLANDVAGAVRADDGTARAVVDTDGEVWNVLGACSGQEVAPAATAVLIGPQHIVLDPGEGGRARGLEAGGLSEAELNLDVARRVATRLRRDGVVVTLTRETDADLSATARGALAPAVGALALVSIHHGEPTSDPAPAPAPTAYPRTDDAESRRLAGLLHQEIGRVLGSAAVDADGGVWTAADESGVRSLLNQRGQDYFAVVRESDPVPAARIEIVAFGDTEQALLRTDEGRELEAEALAAAIVRFLVSGDAGDGFAEAEEEVRDAPTSNSPGGCG